MTTFTTGEVAIVVALIAGALGASVTAFFGRWAEVTNHRRENYADSVKTLSEWSEFPYRIRRRREDLPNDLIALGHELQERLRWHETWISGESPWLAGVYAAALWEISKTAGPACADAWTYPPIASGEDMNLGNWGPEHPVPHLRNVEAAIMWRFGTRRIVGWLGFRKRYAHLKASIQKESR